MEVIPKKYFLALLFSLLAAYGLNAENYITTRDVKFRTRKGPHTHIIGTIKKNTIVDVTQINNVWWAITYDGHDGFVNGKYLKQVPVPIVQKAPVVPERSALPFDLTDSIVAFLMSALIIAVIVKQTRMYIARRKARAAYIPESRTINAIHWYQCKHCRATIKKDSEPGIAGCSQSLRHLWADLGEIGDLKYICKGCSTIVMVKSEPITEGCPNDGDHVWKKI